MDNYGAITVAVISAIATIASVIALIVKSRGENATGMINAKTALDARIDARVSDLLKTAWERIDGLSEKISSLESRETRRSGAITRILRAIASQWPGSNGPDLDPADIAEIEETIPSQWIRRNRHAN